MPDSLPERLRGCLEEDLDLDLDSDLDLELDLERDLDRDLASWCWRTGDLLTVRLRALWTGCSGSLEPTRALLSWRKGDGDLAAVWVSWGSVASWGSAHRASALPVSCPGS